MNEEPMLVNQTDNVKELRKYMNKNPHFLLFGNTAPQVQSYIAIDEGNLHKAFEEVTSVRPSDRNRTNLEQHIPTINFASISMQVINEEKQRVFKQGKVKQVQKQDIVQLRDEY